VSLRSSVYFLLLVLLSCRNKTITEKQPLPDSSSRKFFFRVGVYYGPVKSITQTWERKDEDDIVEIFEWSADGKQIKAWLKGYEDTYSIAFLDSAMRVDSITMHGLTIPNTANVYHNASYYKDYWYYGGTDTINQTNIEIDTTRRIVKYYHNKQLSETNYFNPSGLLVKTENYRANAKDTFAYDEHGFPIYTYVDFLNSKEYNKLESDYQYDSLGNWIKRVDRSVISMSKLNEKKTYTVTRKITYHNK
jgi:hypothetical protein